MRPENTNTCLETISWHDPERNLKINEPVNKERSCHIGKGRWPLSSRWASVSAQEIFRENIWDLGVTEMPLPASVPHGDSGWANCSNHSQEEKCNQGSRPSRQEVWIQNCGSLEWVMEKGTDKFHLLLRSPTTAETVAFPTVLLLQVFPSYCGSEHKHKRCHFSSLTCTVQ